MPTKNIAPLTTGLKGPLTPVESHLLDNQATIESWFEDQWRKYSPPLYCSIDLRNAGFKLSPVDTNLFAAGFNNINEEHLPFCIDAIKDTISRNFSNIQKILLIPESHTRNVFYFENLAVLHKILTDAGFEVRIGSLLEILRERKTITLPSGSCIELEPLIKKDDQLCVEDFTPDLIFLNNDFAEGVPEIFNNITQPIQPPLKMGWETRLKSTHFKYYSESCNELAKLIGLDPWLIQPYFKNCGEVDFVTREGEKCMLKHVDTVLKMIAQKYEEYHVDQTPYVVVKADAGTYGMGVMMVQNADELSTLTHKQRAHMSKTKGGHALNKVIIQEGVHTIEHWGDTNFISEPVMNVFGAHVGSMFYRVHPKRSKNENLNSPGMIFEPTSFADEDTPNRFYAYTVIARLAVLAASLELHACEASL